MFSILKSSWHDLPKANGAQALSCFLKGKKSQTIAQTKSDSNYNKNWKTLLWFFLGYFHFIQCSYPFPNSSIHTPTPLLPHFTVHSKSQRILNSSFSFFQWPRRTSWNRKVQRQSHWASIKQKRWPLPIRDKAVLCYFRDGVHGLSPMTKSTQCISLLPGGSVLLSAKISKKLASSLYSYRHIAHTALYLASLGRTQGDQRPESTFVLVTSCSIVESHKFTVQPPFLWANNT